MTTTQLDIMLVEDNPGDARLIEEMLQGAEKLLQRVDHGDWTDAQLHHEERLDAALDRLAGDESLDVDVVLLDLGLPDSTGLDTLATLADRVASLPIIVLTGLRDEQVGIEAIQHGAQDYLVKDEVTSDLLVRSIHHAIERNRQERKRAHRREQLESLNVLTRELMDAETAAEVSEYVVDAAEGMLGLGVAGVALYDDQGGDLSDIELTEDAAVTLDVDSLLEVGSGAAWHALIGADSLHLLDAEADELADPVAELAILRLAEHGVFFAGSTAAGGFTDADLDFVETVAGNVESALGRVDREQQLHEREALLEEQNQTLERLSRVNDIIRNIAQALVQASSREEIETVVCQQLADAGPYELAWVGEHDDLSGEVTPREWAGNEKGYVDSINATTSDGTSSQGPTAQAVMTREPQVVNDVLEDRSFEPWRQDALNRGYHATIALPLSYEDALYGVLNIYAGQPGVFDDLEQAVLTELADTIAYAINAVESKKALMTHEVTRLTFTVTDDALAYVRLARELDCEVAVENLVSRSDGGVRSYFTTRGADAADVLALLPDLSMLDLTLISEYDADDGPVCLFEADLSEESLESTVLEHGGRPHDVRVADGVATVMVELATEAPIREFVEMFRTKFPDSTLEAQQTHERSHQSPTELRASLTESLTDRQFEALQTAYFSGFFETPRERTGSEIAGSMGISQPTFNQHLRAAQRKLYQRLFERDSFEKR